MFYEQNHTANEAWVGLLNDILRYGQPSAPRDKPIKELLAHQTQIQMRYPLVTMNARKMGYRFAAAEAAWILSGDDRVETIKPYSRDIANFSDDGVTFFGAYGPRIKAQIDGAISALIRDQDTRQAVINIWRENPPASKDIPCSVSVQFLIRNNKLHCLYTMRSSDAWLGWVYDVFNFTMLATYVLLRLLEQPDKFGGLQLGALCLTAGSQHLYRENWSAVTDVLKLAPQRQMEHYPPWEPHLDFSTADELIQTLWDWASRPEGALGMIRELG